MTDRNEMNENNELNDQELEQTAGGIIFEKSQDTITVNYRCPRCGATQKVKTSPGFLLYPPKCPNCSALMKEA